MQEDSLVRIRYTGGGEGMQCTGWKWKMYKNIQKYLHTRINIHTCKMGSIGERGCVRAIQG